MSNQHVIVDEPNSSNDTETLNECTTPKPPKRARMEDNEGGNTSSETESPNSSSSGNGSQESRDSVSDKIPHEVNKWKEENLVDLSFSIQYLDNCTPIELLNMFPRGLQGPFKNAQDYKHFLLDKDQLFDAVESYFSHFYQFPTFDGEFETLCKNHVYDFLSYKAFNSSDFLAKIKPTPELCSWFRRFEVYGTQFGKRLYHMLLKRDLRCTDNANRCLLTEFDFQSLFEAFAAMFGLDSHCWSEPCLLTKKMVLKGTTVSGKADILYCWEIPNNASGTLQEHTNILAVCEVDDIQDILDNENDQRFSGMVKKCGSQTDEQTRRVTRNSTPTVSSSSNLPPHIKLDLLGQHGGELLLYYPYSVKKSSDCIFGIIIQGTEVTLTALKMTQEQYNNILTGNTSKTRPQFFLTKPYNFLKKDERKVLIRPLLELALLQDSKDFIVTGDSFRDKI